MKPPTLYTTEEGAARLGPRFKATTLRRLARHRKVDVTIIGGKYWWTDEQLAQVVEACTRPAAQRSKPCRTSSRNTGKTATAPASNVELLRPDLNAPYGKRRSA